MLTTMPVASALSCWFQALRVVCMPDLHQVPAIPGAASTSRLILPSGSLP